MFRACGNQTMLRCFLLHLPHPARPLCTPALPSSPPSSASHHAQTRPAWRSLVGMSSGKVRPCHASSDSEGVPAEVAQDPKFAPITDGNPSYGPPALLLTGYIQAEVPKVQEFLNGFDGEFMEVLLCTNEMLKGTLWDAMNIRQPDLTKVMVAAGVPRICFLSGLTGEEIMLFITSFSKLDLEPAVFAALVPRNAQKTLEELMEEIMSDHERLSKVQK